MPSQGVDGFDPSHHAVHDVFDTSYVIHHVIHHKNPSDLCCSLASWQKLDICRCFCHPQLSCRLDQISTDHRWNREASACPAEGLEQGMSLTFRGIQGIISHLAITVHRDYPDHFNCHCVVTTISVPSTFFCQHAVNLGVTFFVWSHVGNAKAKDVRP